MITVLRDVAPCHSSSVALENTPTGASFLLKIAAP
jgi:hypothetical protein